MKFLEFYQKPRRIRINENRQQYQQMMQIAVDNNLIDQATANEIIKWARENLARNDRIVWWLTYYRMMLAFDPKVLEQKENELKKDPANRDLNEEQIQELAIKWAKKITKYGGNAQGWVLNQIRVDFKQHFLPSTNSMRHFLDMMDQVPGMNEITWEKNINPRTMADMLHQTEQEWAAKRRPWIKPSDYGHQEDVLLSYNNGEQAWINLNRESCRIEGDAMGHCGNTANPRPGERILSFRTIKGDEQKPHLTFILDANGMLGEMKGRANRKPDPKYHPYIIDLLKQDFVKGIKGGGYAPEENFELDDLTENQMAGLLSVKPQLGGAIYMWVANNKQYNPEIGQVIKDVIEDTLGFVSFDVETGEIVAQTYADIAEIGREMNDRTLENIGNLNIFAGSNGMDLYFHYSDYSNQLLKDPHQYKNEIEDIVYGMKKDQLDRLEYYLSTIGDWEDEDGDIDVIEALIYLIENDSDSEVVDALARAFDHGHWIGTEQAIVDAVDEHLLDNNIESIDTRYSSLNEPYALMVSVDTVLNEVYYGESREDTTPEQISYYLSNIDWSDIAGYRNFVEPRYGWEGYDETAASEEFVNQLYDLIEDYSKY